MFEGQNEEEVATSGSQHDRKKQQRLKNVIKCLKLRTQIKSTTVKLFIYVHTYKLLLLMHIQTEKSKYKIRFLIGQHCQLRTVGFTAQRQCHIKKIYINE